MGLGGSSYFGTCFEGVLGLSGLVGSVHEIGCLKFLGNRFAYFYLDGLEALGFSSLCPENYNFSE